MARYFSLLRQRKVPKRKACPAACPLTRVPCASREARRLRNSRSHCARLAQTGRKRHPVFTAMLGCANGLKFKRKNQNSHSRPVCTHRVPQTIRDQGRSCLSVASSAHPLIVEERRVSALADECSGCPSLWVLSLGQARESTSPSRRNKKLKSTSTFRAKEKTEK